MTIKNPKWIDEDTSYSITGTVINESQKEAQLVTVYALLYDANNNIIKIGSGIKPGDNSAFKVIFMPKHELPDHYTLIPDQF